MQETDIVFNLIQELFLPALNMFGDCFHEALLVCMTYVLVLDHFLQFLSKTLTVYCSDASLWTMPAFVVIE